MNCELCSTEMNFLYDVVESTEYRTGGYPWTQTAPGKFVKPEEPMRAECHYTVTAWAREGAPAPEQDEHLLLGAAMRALSKYRIIPDFALYGAMREVEYPIHARPLATGRLGSPGEFWQALGGKPRPFFNYMTILSFTVREPQVSTAAVTGAKVNITRTEP